MQLSMSVHMEQKMILGVELTGGSTGLSNTIFPIVAQRLRKSLKLQRALDRVKVSEGWAPEEYRSYMDFLVAAICPEAVPLIVGFYNREGLPLREQITDGGRFGMEILLLGAVEAACLAYDNHLEVNWNWIRRIVSVLTHDLPPIRVFANGIPPLVELADCSV